MLCIAMVTFTGAMPWLTARVSEAYMNTFFSSQVRTIYAFGWGYLILTMQQRIDQMASASILKGLFSLNFWVPLARMTYSIYLVHIPVVHLMPLEWFQTSKEQICPFEESSIAEFATYSAACAAVYLPLAMVIYLVAERPAQ